VIADDRRRTRGEQHSLRERLLSLRSLFPSSRATAEAIALYQTGVVRFCIMLLFHKNAFVAETKLVTFALPRRFFRTGLCSSCA
jgi:hypothetical protein